MVYESQKSHPSTEQSSIQPWTTLARYKKIAENNVLEIAEQGLNAYILRPAFVYGPGDWHEIITRAVCAACYSRHGLNETMSLLWDGDMRINTVHVDDVCRAIWHIGTMDSSNLSNNRIWNLCDKSDLTVRMV
jgi:nucleoside-diphosphate-sugar epimerase